MQVQPMARSLVACEDMRVSGKKVSLLNVVLNISASAYPVILVQLWFSPSLRSSR